VDLGLASGPALADSGLLGMLLGNPLEPDSIAAVGRTPFLDAWVVFWLWAVATGNLRKMQSDRPLMDC
jgi:hypothetical protein